MRYTEEGDEGKGWVVWDEVYGGGGEGKGWVVWDEVHGGGGEGKGWVVWDEVHGGGGDGDEGKGGWCGMRYTEEGVTGMRGRVGGVG